MHAGCPICHALAHFLDLAHIDITRRAVEALERGPEWGLILRAPHEGSPESDDILPGELVDITVELAPICDLITAVPMKPHDPEAAARLCRDLLSAAPPGYVHVLGVFRGCSATFCARADRERLEEMEETSAWKAQMVALAKLAFEEIAARIWPGLPSDAVFLARTGEDGGAHVELVSRVEALERIPFDDVHDPVRALEDVLIRPPGLVLVVMVRAGGFSIGAIPAERVRTA
jgi:hypothetical protein